MYTLIKTKTYEKSENKYRQSLGDTAFDKMEDQLKENPIYKPNRITKLEGQENRYRYRLGDYRVLYTVLEEEVEVLLVEVGPRGGIYK